MMKLNDYVRMKSYPELRGRVTWVDPEVDAEGRVIHVMCDGAEYRANESSLELVVIGEIE